MADTTVEEAGQLQRSKKKIRNNDGDFRGETSRVPREEEWMLAVPPSWKQMGKGRPTLTSLCMAPQSMYLKTLRTRARRVKLWIPLICPVPERSAKKLQEGGTVGSQHHGKASSEQED
ncbi:hypothetical protein PIB30_072659 [Stylosanthes scabra]|uniref:Uncharacterized protein n=1 Tax=Stylosanthes scabra TaxID=79078 RepID=A0ABU6ZMS6_9FABA|nr:hypothetical protein [Stylosanthes scabra]